MSFELVPKPKLIPINGWDSVDPNVVCGVFIYRICETNNRTRAVVKLVLSSGFQNDYMFSTNEKAEQFAEKLWGYVNEGVTR
jgi:hypothetical protein